MYLLYYKNKSKCDELIRYKNLHRGNQEKSQRATEAYLWIALWISVDLCVSSYLI